MSGSGEARTSLHARAGGSPCMCVFKGDGIMQSWRETGCEHRRGCGNGHSKDSDGPF